MPNVYLLRLSPIPGFPRSKKRLELLAENGAVVLASAIIRTGTPQLTHAVLDMLQNRKEKFVGCLLGEPYIIAEPIVGEDVSLSPDEGCELSQSRDELAASIARGE